jgi:hypothetical protein
MADGETMKYFNRDPIGTRTSTGAIKIGDDCFVSDWVWRGAPFKARPAISKCNNWRIDDRMGQLARLAITEQDAVAGADELNTLAAAAQLLKE